MGDYKMCMCFIRRFKINDVEPPFDVRQAFSKYTDGANLMTAEQLLRFLIEFQGETSATIADAEQIIHQVMHRRHLIVAFTKHVLTSEDFQHFLFSDDLNSPITNQVHHDMTAPLSHYFTYTGHNSYLTGNQLSSDCSDAPIIKALIRGVRVIELDIWPNSTRDNVNVLHGRTLTTPVALIKCLKAIKEYAFSTSPYPVVITLEDHLNADLQAKVAEMVTQIFGDMLYFPDTDCLEEFPSPESLKYRIILSTKPPKEYLEAKNLKEKISSEEESWDKELLDPDDGLSVEYTLFSNDFSFLFLFCCTSCSHTKSCFGWQSDSEVGEHIQDEDVNESAHESGVVRGPEVGEHIQDEDVNENAHEAVPVRGFKRLDAKKKKGEGELRELLEDDDVNESIFDSGQVGGPKYKHLHAKMKEDKGELKKFLQDGEVKDSGRSPGQAGGPEYKRLGAKKKKGEGELRELLEDDEIYESYRESFQLQEAEYKHLDDKNNEGEGCDVVPKSRSNPGQVGGPEYKRLDAKKKKAKGELRELLQDDDLSESKCNSEQVVSPRHKRLTAMFSKKIRGDRKLNGSIHNDDDKEDENKSALARAPEYKRLIAIHAKKKKGGLKESLQLDPVSVRRLSLSEQSLLKARSNHGIDLVRFTQRNLLRVYPRGTRFDSSNYNPLTGWMHGAQMVAFNMQGYGKSLWLMQGMFRSNGGCGYVKKPDILMVPDPLFDPKVRLPVKKTLKVKIYMGDGWRLDFNKTHFDAYSPPDFYTRVGIAGVPADVVMHKTKIMEDDWTPVWDKEFSFPLTVPELALLRIEVQEYDLPEKNDFGGQTCLPVWELRPGIRAVPLFNRKGEKFKSVRLLMQFQFV
ncbi:phosphoinositide phospholipase C [Ranunculus cassubicifolius]